ncbi:MAG: hypothetical protein P8Q97_04320 [Myxococcota bacterium]|nr:hypothetical protein [Myxococcota bacterium]
MSTSRNTTIRLTLWLCLASLAFGIFAVSSAEAFEITTREVGSSTLNESELVTKSPGDTVSIEFVVDTAGIEIWGFSFGLAFNPASLSAFTVQNANLPPLLPLGSSTVDAAAGTISNISQVGFFSGLAPGVYVVGTADFTVDTIPPGGIDLITTMGPSESMIVAGETCPGSLPGCTVTLYPMKIVSSPSVPTLSPLGVLLMIGLLFSTSFWALGPGRNLSRSMVRNGRSALMLLALIPFSLAAAPSASAAADKTAPEAATRPVLDASSPKLTEEWGIEIVAMRLSGENRFLDFRYRVVDVEKAGALFGPKIRPFLVDRNTGHTLKVPVPPKLGPMKSSRSQPKKDRVFFVFFANPGGTAETGHKVDVDFGPLMITGIAVQ